MKRSSLIAQGTGIAIADSGQLQARRLAEFSAIQ
jgi:hypothetical protein